MFGSLLAGGLSLVGGLIGSSGAKKAAKTQAAAQQAAIDEQRRQFDLTREDYAPYRYGGTQAYNMLAGMYGISPYVAPSPVAAPIQQNNGGVLNQLADHLRGGKSGFGRLLDGSQPGFSDPNAGKAVAMGGKMDIGSYGNPPQIYGNQFSQSPDGKLDIGSYGDPPQVYGNQYAQPGSAGGNFAPFFASPDYQYNLSEGLKAVEGSAAARGGLYSGNNLRALQQTGAGLASREFGNYKNTLANLAGIGQQATDSTAAFGANMAGNVGNLLSSQGNARASGIAGSTNAWGNALGNIGGLAYNYFNNRGGGSPVNIVPQGQYSLPRGW